jgi:hypothetical protein
VAKLVAIPLATIALRVESRHSKKFMKVRHKQRSGQHIFYPKLLYISRFHPHLFFNRRNQFSFAPSAMEFFDPSSKIDMNV